MTFHGSRATRLNCQCNCLLNNNNSSNQRDFSMAMILSYVATARSTSAKIALTGVILTCLVIALPAYLYNISSFSIVEIETHGSHAAAAYSTVDLPMAMKVDSKIDITLVLGCTLSVVY